MSVGSASTRAARGRITNASMLASSNWMSNGLAVTSDVGDLLPNINPMHGVEPMRLVGWLDTYCAAHPTETIARAAREFATENPRGFGSGPTGY